MRIIQLQKAKRRAVKLVSPAGFSRLTQVLGAILLFALFCPPAQTFGATVPAGQSITLTWNANPDPAVAGYTVHYGPASNTYLYSVNVGNVTNAAIPGLTAGATYYFAVTAYDSVGTQSDYSNEASYVVPTLTAQMQIHSAPAGKFVLTVTGPVGNTYEIQATTDFTNWSVIGTGVVGNNGSLNFTDANAGSYSRRFYRTQGTQ